MHRLTFGKNLIFSIKKQSILKIENNVQKKNDIMIFKDKQKA